MRVPVQDTPKARAHAGPRTHSSQPAVGPQPVSGPHAFSTLAAARAQEPFDPWCCQLSTHLSGGEAHTLPAVGTGAGCQVAGL